MLFHVLNTFFFFFHTHHNLFFVFFYEMDLICMGVVNIHMDLVYHHQDQNLLDNLLANLQYLHRHRLEQNQEVELVLVVSLVDQLLRHRNHV